MGCCHPAPPVLPSETKLLQSEGTCSVDLPGVQTVASRVGWPLVGQCKKGLHKLPDDHPLYKMFGPRGAAGCECFRPDHGLITVDLFFSSGERGRKRPGREEGGREVKGGRGHNKFADKDPRVFCWGGAFPGFGRHVRIVGQ